MTDKSTTPAHFADRLLAAIEASGSPVCVGIDPNPALLPAEFQLPNDPQAQADAVGRWASEILEIVQPFVPAVKPQIAYFEALRGPAEAPFPGMTIYADIVAAARKLGLIVIGDAKRGDIGSTASAYASAHLAGSDDADALTVNGYFGADGLMPFTDIASSTGRGLFVLVRTSNPSGTAVQNFAASDGQMFYEHIAQQVADLGSTPGFIGSSGYSCIGAVVGATCPAEAHTLRNLMPQQIFLVPGYGAQGATAQDCAASFKPDGTGAIVNASRSVIYAHQKSPATDWKMAVKQAAKAFASDIAAAVK
jgi:orotidine-5'-phosphate decarboxylase